MTAVIAVALISFAVCVLVGMCGDVLITAQDRNMFEGDSLYFCNTISRPFGLFQYVGGFLTQYFYYPILGAAMLIALWVASVFVGIKAFRLKGLWRWLIDDVFFLAADSQCAEQCGKCNGCECFTHNFLM